MEADRHAAEAEDIWAEYAPGWDDEPATRAYAAAAHQSLVDVFTERGRAVADLAIVDFGCGTGLLTEHLIDAAEVIDAVDSSSAMLEVLDAKIAARGWTNVRSSIDLPNGPGTHSLVVCSSVCGFLDDYSATVAQLAELLQPGGLFVQWDWEREDAEGLSREEITAALTAAGLVDIHVGIAFEAPFGDEVMRPLIGVGQKPAS